MTPATPAWHSFDPYADGAPDSLRQILPAGSEEGGVVVIAVADEVDQGGWPARVAIQLTETLAARASRVLLIDLRFNTPSLTRELDEPPGEGISDVFLFGASVHRVARAVRAGAFLFAPTGTVTGDPAKVLAHPGWDQLLTEYRTSGTLVVLYLRLGADGSEAMLERADRLILLAGPDRQLPGEDLTIAWLGPESLAVVEEDEEALDGQEADVPAASAEEEDESGALEPVEIGSLEATVVDVASLEPTRTEDLDRDGDLVADAPVETESVEATVIDVASLEPTRTEELDRGGDLVADAPIDTGAAGHELDDDVDGAFADMTDTPAPVVEDAASPSSFAEESEADRPAELTTGDSPSGADASLASTVGEAYAEPADDTTDREVPIEALAPDAGGEDLDPFWDEAGSAVASGGTDELLATIGQAFAGSTDSDAAPTTEKQESPADEAPKKRRAGVPTPLIALAVVLFAAAAVAVWAILNRGNGSGPGRQSAVTEVRMQPQSMAEEGSRSAAAGAGTEPASGAAQEPSADLPETDRTSSEFTTPSSESGAAATSDARAEPAEATTGPTTPAPEAGRFGLAVNAHESIDAARAQALRLERRFPDLQFIIVPVAVNRIAYYRVIASPAASSAEAEGVRQRLSGVLGASVARAAIVRSTRLGYLVGEFQTPDEARSRREALRAAGIPAYVMQLGEGETVPYRVYSGAFANTDEATYLGILLSDAGLGGATLVERAGRLVR